MTILMYQIPLGAWVDRFVDFLTDNFAFIFEGAAILINWIVSGIASILAFAPALLLIAIFTALAWWTSRWPIGIFTGLGLLLIYNLGYWDGTILTLSLVLTAVFISIVIGVPIGIWSSQNNTVKNVLTPILDFMQTMPAFVYLIPAILFFGIGMVPGIIASVVFAMPPTIRLTNLGIRQVPDELVEASNAFGSTRWQKLKKVQLPLATPTIMAGINQSIMLALSMVVIASLVGAPGLGTDVYRAVTQIQVGTGFEAGLSIVILAIMLDRISQNLGRRNSKE
ncbi:ABC transporter permease [Bacillus sp. FJAT-44742]|uniref:ABC transporter permease n=1 Tax=Bacillus sp. FJAT-44742 TaxID=2014005 RepID=UPI000C25044C|nr:proline/glycine betaine ABC transporter permease [Bacillus sp. FJAT-44742]